MGWPQGCVCVTGLFLERSRQTWGPHCHPPLARTPGLLAASGSGALPGLALQQGRPSPHQRPTWGPRGPKVLTSPAQAQASRGGPGSCGYAPGSGCRPAGDRRGPSEGRGWAPDTPSRAQQPMPSALAGSLGARGPGAEAAASSVYWGGGCQDPRGGPVRRCCRPRVSPTPQGRFEPQPLCIWPGSC